MTDHKVGFSVRSFLRERGALLVHFSTPMTHHTYLFPDDLQNAVTLRDKPLSFSAILPGDLGPYQTARPETANACGSVGIVVDIQDEGSVLTVGPSDDGTYFDEPSGEYRSGGCAPTREACVGSIDQRQTSNEWFVQNYATIGIFVFCICCPIMVRQAITIASVPIVAETEIGLDAVLKEFFDHRLFTAHDGRFLEFDRKARAWLPVDYEVILPVGAP